MKAYYVFTHYDLPGLRVEAATKAEALLIGLELRKDAEIPGGHFGCEVAGCDGPAFVSAKPAKPLEKPYACLIPQNRSRRF